MDSDAADCDADIACILVLFNFVNVYTIVIAYTRASLAAAAAADAG